MKHSVLTLFLTGMILLLIIAVPVAAESSTITSVSPAVGYTGTTTTVTITGTNFNTSSVKVKLMMEDESNITSTVSSFDSTTIVCKFTISSAKTTGDWDLVVINEDESEVVDSGAFSIRDPMVLTSVSPDNARTNNASVDVTIAGTGLDNVAGFYLYNADYSNVTASNVDAVSSTEVTGSLDLTDAGVASYKVCLLDSAGTKKCGLSFEVESDAVGTIDLSSSPSGAAIYIDSEYVGTTPYSAEGLDVGSHKVILKKTGYTDWAKLVKVTESATTTVDADLVATTTEPTTFATPVPTHVPTTARVIPKATTVKVPTTWPSTTAETTPASPLDGAVVLGAIGLGVVALHRK